MKVAIPHWQGRVSPVLDVAERIRCYEINMGKYDGPPSDIKLTAEPPQMRALRFSEIGIDVLICGAVSRNLAMMIIAKGIELIPFVSGSLEDVLEAYLSGDIVNPGYSMPGCRGQQTVFGNYGIGGRGHGPGKKRRMGLGNRGPGNKRGFNRGPGRTLF